MKKVGMILLLTLCSILLWGNEENEQSRIKAVLFPFREAIIASRIDSVLLPYSYKIGERFESGSEIVKLDDAKFVIELKRVTEQHAFAKATYDDQVQLREKQFTSDYEVKKREFEYRILENNVADAQLNLTYCKIKAPFSGKIIEILSRESETVRAGQPLFRMIDDDQLLAVMNVPLTNKYLTTLKSKVKIRIPNHQLEVEGEVYEVMPQADHRTDSVRIRVLLDNRKGALRAGMTGELCNGQ